jgi:hypothetical protein
MDGSLLALPAQGKFANAPLASPARLLAFFSHHYCSSRFLRASWLRIAQNYQKTKFRTR